MTRCVRWSVWTRSPTSSSTTPGTRSRPHRGATCVRTASTCGMGPARSSCGSNPWPGGVGVVHAEQFLDLPGPVQAGPTRQGVRPTPPGQGFDPHEDRAGPMPHVLAVLTQVAPRCGRDRVAGVVEELVGLLVHTDHRTHRVMDPGVDTQHVFHPGRELRVRLRWDGPALLQMRTKFRFFKTRPMVE